LSEIIAVGTVLNGTPERWNDASVRSGSEARWSPLLHRPGAAVAPVMFRRREFCEGAGGAGEFRGGLGQIIELGGADGTPIAMLCNFERVGNPARGRDGGATGAPGRVTLVSGRPIGPKGRQSVPGGDFIRLELPGGGGFGNPAARDPEHVALDVADGPISREAAEHEYRVAFAADGAVDRAAFLQSTFRSSGGNAGHVDA
jgi:N-methylhydantoinase B